MTTEDVRTFVEGGDAVVLVPVGSVEPHGPHLPLGTDTVISEVVATRAARELRARGTRCVVAPEVPYGVTDYAEGFPGAIGVPADVLTAFLTALAERFVRDGFGHVSFVNNHLEPAQDAAVRAVADRLPKGRISIACPLTRRWGRTLSEEFKKGACHAGRYETSLVMAAGGPVRDSARSLPALTISLSDGIREGLTTFHAMGMDRAYTGAPAEATSAEGDDLYARLVSMTVAEVLEGLASR
ncbi:MAG: creatininase family protein [Polyangiaceae bacterium]